jgi:type II secretory pathway component PulF
MFLSIALGIFVLYLFSNVVPKITKILIDMKLELPLITKIIVFISDVAINTWYIWIIAGIAIPLLYNLIIKKNQALMLIADSVKLELPVFGTLIRLLIQARFTHNFAILHRAGISVIENIELCKGFIGNALFQKALIKASSDVQQGITLSASLKSSGLFNGLVLRMFAVGEASGDLENSLNHASLYYDEEVPRRVKRVFSILEPMIIIVLVGIIGAVALAILLPIMSISQGLGG